MSLTIEESQMNLVTSNPTTVPRLRLVLMRLARKLRQQAAGNVTPSMLSALSSIDSIGPLTLGELATVEQIQPPTMTQIVSRLEDTDYVVRQVDPSDRRVARVQVTPAGKKFLTKNRSRKDAYLAQGLRKLSPSEVETLERAIPILERLLEEQD
ncbi:MAG TPA: MarR family transcriptional regulator [Actinomycetota bacterium]|nr:MarR family transcriptional regulator [Actinomycetota bacterium]